jgi:hypothetical protein
MPYPREHEHERTLDEEGVPDLEGPLPEKAATGDPQEGLPPPNEKPRASRDWGVTEAEQRMDEPLDDRLAREEPDDDQAPRAESREMVQPVPPEGSLADDEKDEIAEAAEPEGAVGPEESAVRVESESRR